MIKRAIMALAVGCTCILALSGYANDYNAESSIAERKAQNAFQAGNMSFNGLAENTSGNNSGFRFGNRGGSERLVPRSKASDTGAKIAMLGATLSCVVLLRRKLS